MAWLHNSAPPICRERILNVSRREHSTQCALTNHSQARLPLLLASHIAIGDEIMFSIPDGTTIGTEVYLNKESTISGARHHVYLMNIGFAKEPQNDKRSQPFVSVQVQHGNLGISSIFLPCVRRFANISTA